MPAPQVDGVDFAFITRVMRLAATAAEAGLECGGDGAPRPAPAFGDPRPSDTVRAGFLQHTHAFADVIAGVNGVCVHADDDLTAGGGDRGIETGRDDPAGVVD